MMKLEATRPLYRYRSDLCGRCLDQWQELGPAGRYGWHRTGVLNNISGVHQTFFNAGGLGILIGDGQLPNPGLEKIFEAYYSYALARDRRLTFDYQFIANPAYNTDRGPVNTFAARFHAQF
jgi:hypothetical protein